MLASGSAGLVILTIRKTLYFVKQFKMADPINPDKWISQKRAAEIREVSRQAINELVQKGRFDTQSIGGKTLVKREDVENYEPRKGGRPPSSTSSDSSSEED